MRETPHRNPKALHYAKITKELAYLGGIG